MGLYLRSKPTEVTQEEFLERIIPRPLEGDINKKIKENLTLSLFDESRKFRTMVVSIFEEELDMPMLAWGGLLREGQLEYCYKAIDRYLQSN